jgi:hypothetical protein
VDVVGHDGAGVDADRRALYSVGEAVGDGSRSFAREFDGRVGQGLFGLLTFLLVVWVVGE